MNTKTLLYYPNLLDIRNAVTTLKDVVIVTPLSHNMYYSWKFDSNIFLK